ERSEESVSSVPKCHSERSEAEPRNPSLSSILVHPSPWNGKESWHDAPAAPLAGLILLERGDHNELLPLSAREAGIPVYLQMIHTNRDVEHIKQAAAMTTLLLGSVPAWKLISYQVPDSTKLLLETLFQSDRL
ncbi:MAG: hypothetical protein IJQ02_04915, partial [Oscillospiraceae bacterium]|nr:hypothetical protein [Oscillospiraceae bacterium]